MLPSWPRAGFQGHHGSRPWFVFPRADWVTRVQIPSSKESPESSCLGEGVLTELQHTGRDVHSRGVRPPLVMGGSWDGKGKGD